VNTGKKWIVFVWISIQTGVRQHTLYTRQRVFFKLLVKEFQEEMQWEKRISKGVFDIIKHYAQLFGINKHYAQHHRWFSDET
jgi:hypothetical protein